MTPRFSWVSLLCATLWLNFAVANTVSITDKQTQICSGMYSKKDWSGPVDPYISFDLKKLTEDGLSVVIFDFQDYIHLGAKSKAGSTKYICDDEAIEESLCTEEDRNKFIVVPEVYDPESETKKSLATTVQTFYLEETGLVKEKYQVKRTGYYCVGTFTRSGSVSYKADVNFRNSFGNLAAAEINKLPLYGLLAIFYVVAMALYLFAFWKHKHELLPLQKYLLAAFIFLTIDTIFIWGYYDLKNNKGNTAGTTVYMVIVSILNSAKITMSLFLLLVVCKGYGVVYPKLNKTTMRRVQFFSVLTFALSVAALIQNYMTPTDSTSLIPLFFFIPLGICFMVFYFLILQSLEQTVKYLKQQKQIVKLGMYKKLIIIFYVALFVIFGGIILSSFVLIGMSSIEMIEQHWRTRFFFVDFWPSLVYYAVFVALSFTWRPTSTSYMLAVSQQLPTDPENVADFDLDDLQSLEQEWNQEYEQPAGSQPNDADLDFSDDETDKKKKPAQPSA
ncbi:unnamed protein product [Kluyveromyces dobzhanskii CBS 2104]|uniref:WGS project CCBQ000000000 data, contig 00058 n=1 Tax=Kluyveromyces dobzhanskii CBS 2104 TaxID=1427455 RepID=A0A0A8LBN8_9SACH|nr:unnamed protein product [Kluyveromyces dobzhanskii CBS 2104]